MSVGTEMSAGWKLGSVPFLHVLSFGTCTYLSFWPGGNWQKLVDRYCAHLAVLFQGPAASAGLPAEDPR